MTTTLTALRYVDADGHVLEHPSGMREFAPPGYEDRVWHIETDERGREWAVMDGHRLMANAMALAGTAGMSLEDRERAQRLELKYTEDWKPLNDPVYDPLWKAASDAAMPVAFHPFLAADLPGACIGLRINRLHSSALPPQQAPDEPAMNVDIDNIYFTQAIANPVDMMSTIAFVLAGGVCERFPDLRLLFLEANGGWIVPLLERLDHHAVAFPWDVPTLKQAPSAYFRRQ